MRIGTATIKLKNIGQGGADVFTKEGIFVGSVFYRRQGHWLYKRKGSLEVDYPSPTRKAAIICLWNDLQHEYNEALAKAKGEV